VTAGRHLVFPFLAVFLPTTKPEKSIADNITAAGVFQRRSKPVEKRLFTQTKPMCELVEGIVTVALTDFGFVPLYSLIECGPDLADDCGPGRR
jgi:hypothetical protein